MEPNAIFIRMRQHVPLLLIFLSATIALACYLQALNYPFIGDDTAYVPDNIKLAKLHWFELWQLFTQPFNIFSEFLPLRELSYWFDLTLFGLTPGAFRLDSMVLYLLCLSLMYATTLALWRYFRPSDATSASWAAATVTALFALHPSHAEAVVWIAGRKDVLSGMFSLLAIWLALGAKREQGLSVLYASATLVALLAAMLSKATAVAIAPIIAMLWVIFWLDIPKHHKRYLQLLWPLACLLLALCITLIFASIVTSRVPLYIGTESVTRSLGILGWLARLSISPESRHYLYPLFEDPNFFLMVVLGMVVLLAVVASGVIFLRKRSLKGFAVVVFFLLCLPSLQLIPYAPPSLISDRFLFLAVWPVILLGVAFSWRLKPSLRITLLLIIASSWIFQTIQRPRDYSSFEVLIETDLRAFPGYSMPAKYTFDTQLLAGQLREAEETASNITTPEIRDVMVKVIKTQQVISDLTATSDPQYAMSLLLDLGKDLKYLPAQARWNTPLVHIWRANRIFLGLDWYRW